MASVAPTVTSTSVSGSSSRPYQAALVRGHGLAQLGDALRWAGTGCGPSRMAATATSRSSSGPSVSGKPWPRLTEPVASGQLGHGGEDRRGEGLQAPGQMRVPCCHRDDRTNGDVARLSSGRTVLSIANYNMHCGMDGWGRPYDYLGCDRRARRRRHRARGGLDGRGRRRAAARRRRRPGISATRSWRTRSARGGASGPSPDAAATWSARRPVADRNRALYMDGVRPLSARRADPGRAGRRPSPGPWGIAVLVRPELPIEATRLVPMTHPAGRPRPAGRDRGRPHGGRPADLGGGHPHVAPALWARTATGPSCAGSCGPRPGPTRCWPAT